MDKIDPEAGWPGWETERLIGRGNFGAVYEIRRQTQGETERAALKHIRIPGDDWEIAELRKAGCSQEKIALTLREQLQTVLQSYERLRWRKDSPYLVSCEDPRCVQREDGLGWDVLIKMELLTPLSDSRKSGVTNAKILRMGRDLCRALIQCREHGLTRLGICPSHILVTETGSYKLWDFGAGLALEEAGRDPARSGAEYEAPEEGFGQEKDIYSLGLVLYWMLNEGRLPFLPLPPERPSVSQKEQAWERRMDGEALPPPAHGSRELRRIVRKACAFDPQDRYASAEEMLEDLEELRSAMRRSKAARKAKKTARTRRNWLVGVLGVAVAALLLVLLLPRGKPEVPVSAADTEQTAAPVPSPAAIDPASPAAEPQIDTEPLSSTEAQPTEESQPVKESQPTEETQPTTEPQPAEEPTPADQAGTAEEAQSLVQASPSGENDLEPGKEIAMPGLWGLLSGEDAVPEPTPALVTLSGGSFPADIRELATVITAADIPLLDGFTGLQKADFSGSKCQKELVAWALQHPEISVRCEVRLSDGTELSADTRELELSDAVPGEDLLALVLLPKLKTVELGECLDAAESPLDWEALARAEAACPQAEFHYSFKLYRKSFDLQSTEMDLNHIAMTDEGALVKKVAACLPELTLLDMDFCEVSDEAMADIRDSLPDTEVVWRIWFGDNRVSGYSVRTNVTKILASNPGRGGELTPENTKSLKYCTKVIYLDLGHNDQMTDISFVSCMPDLEVAVLAMGGFSDLSPLADCPKLEYLEIQTGAVSDLRPLSGLKNLRHLNIAWNFALTDITPLYELTELERLWIGGYDPVPREQVEEMQRRAPNCVINITAGNPTEEGWRYTEYDSEGHGVLHPRYLLLYEQFEYGRAPYCYSYIPYDPLYKPHDDN